MARVIGCDGPGRDAAQASTAAWTIPEMECDPLDCFPGALERRGGHGTTVLPRHLRNHVVAAWADAAFLEHRLAFEHGAEVRHARGHHVEAAGGKSHEL